MNIPLTADSRTTKDKFFSYVEAKGLGASLLIGCKFNSNAGKAEALERILRGGDAMAGTRWRMHRGHAEDTAPACG